MAFPDDVVKQAWDRAGGRCECTRRNHGHRERCNRPLIWFYRGLELPGGWEAHHKTAGKAGGADTLSNCEILCQACHKATQTYGS